MGELKGVHYDAFISYRHCELDSFVAERLHRKLENFKLPKSVRNKVKDGKTKISRVFRDVDELPLSENLSDPISNALANSDYLITICSPRYLESRWCMKEIEEFLQIHDRDHVLVVLADDEPCNSFPKILMYSEITHTDENGNTVTEKKELEPLAADTRGANKKEILKAMDTAVIKICAAIFGLNYDDLRQRHREEKIRKYTAIYGGITLAVLGIAVFASVMLIKISRQNQLIESQYAELTDRFAGTMALAADKLMGEGRRMDAIYALRSVLPDNTDTPYNPDVLRRLYSCLNVYGGGDQYAPVMAYGMDSMISGFSVSPNGEYLLINDNLKICVYEIESGDLIWTKEGNDKYSFDIFYAGFVGNDGLIVFEGGEAYYTTLKKDEKLVEYDWDDPSYYLFSETSSDDAAVVFANDVIHGVGEDGEILFEIDPAKYYKTDKVYISDAEVYGDMFAMTFTDEDSYYVYVGDIHTGEKIISLFDYALVEATVELTEDYIYIAVSGYTDDSFNLSTEFYKIDITNGTTMWIQKMDAFMTHDIMIDEDYVYIYDMYSVYVFEKKYGTKENSFNTSEIIDSCWLCDNCLYYLLADGSVHICDYQSNYENYDFYTFAPTEFIAQSQYVNGELLILFSMSNDVIRYSMEKGPDVKILNEEVDYDYQDYEMVVDEVSDIEGVNIGLVENAFYSDDEKYILVANSNRTVQIIDSDKEEVISNLEVENADFISFEYYDTTEGYIIGTYYESYILDDNFDIICETTRVYTEKKDNLIMYAYLSYIKAPFYSYEEIIAMADEYLGDYEPDEATKLKYNMQ